MGFLLDSHTCIELGDKGVILHLLLPQFRERGLWPVSTPLGQVLWLPLAPLLAERERLLPRHPAGEIVLSSHSSTDLHCVSGFAVEATVRRGGREAFGNSSCADVGLVHVNQISLWGGGNWAVFR